MEIIFEMSNTLEMFNTPEISRCSEVFRYRLAQLLIEKDVKKTDLRENLGMTRGTVGRYLSGEREPDFKHLLALSLYFHVSLDWLTGRDSEMPLIHEEEVILKSYRNASDDDRKVIDLLLSKYNK